MSLYWKVIMTTALANAVILAIVTPWMMTQVPFSLVGLFAVMEGILVGIWSGMWLVPQVERVIWGKNRGQKRR